MEFDDHKIDEAALALLHLTLHEGNRAWKTIAWEVMDRLHQRGLISLPASQAKSVVLGRRRFVFRAAGGVLHGHEHPIAGFLRGLAELEHHRGMRFGLVADVSSHNGVQILGFVRQGLAAAREQAFRSQIVYRDKLPIFAPLLDPDGRGNQQANANNHQGQSRGN